MDVRAGDARVAVFSSVATLVGSVGQAVRIWRSKLVNVAQFLNEIWLAEYRTIFGGLSACFGVLLALAASSCAPAPDAPVARPQDEGTRRMVNALSRIRSATTANDVFANYVRADAYRHPNPEESEEEALTRRFAFARELLFDGRTEEAIDEFGQLRELLRARQDVQSADAAYLVTMMLALAYLRLGEQENCLLSHTAASCLFPIMPEGVHQLPRGSRMAVAEFARMLQESPDDWNARWLLNLAHMTLGEYPAGVPPSWLIPPSVFEDDFDIGRFRDVAPAVGVDVQGGAGGSAAEDFDLDGDIDLVVSSWNLLHNVRYLVNNGDGTFSDRTLQSGLEGITGGLNLVHADYDNDGYSDVLVLRGAWRASDGRYPNSLLRNNGDGTFSDVTFEAGIFSLHPTQTAAWADFDHDGWLDVFIGNESTPGDLHPSELFRNNGDGTFTDVALQTGVELRAYVKGVVWTDIDNDGWPDLYVSLFDAPNLLFRNESAGADGGRRFREISESAGVGEPVKSFPVWTFDFDNDGWLDLFVSSYAAELADIASEYLGLPHNGQGPRLYRNDRDGTYTDVTAEVGLDRITLTMGCNFGDLDNDGFPDFYLGTGDPDLRKLIPNRMFRNDAGRRFQEVTTSGGVGHLQKGHGVSFADFDHDGDLDIHAVMGGAYTGDVYQNVLFENPGHGNRHLTLLLEGRASNRSAIGSRIRVKVGASQGGRNIFATVSSGSSFGGNPLRQHVGLGPTGEIEEVEIRWPSGLVQSVEQLEPGGSYRIVEGDDGAERLRLAPAPFAHRPSDHTAPAR